MDILPISKIVVEIANFDIQRIENPDIKGKEYQEGPTSEYNNLRHYIYARDNYKCHYKKSRPDIVCSETMTVDHIIPKSKGGVDSRKNLVCSCKAHNDAKDNMSYKKFTKSDPPTREPSFKYAALINSIKYKLLDEVESLVGNENIEATFGYLTKETREKWDKMPKTHINDAIAIAGIRPKEITPVIWLTRKGRKKKRQLHDATCKRFPVSGKTGKRGRNTTQNKYYTLGDKVYFKFKNDKGELVKTYGYLQSYGGGKAARFRDIRDTGYILRTEKSNIFPLLQANKFFTFVCRNNNWIQEPVSVEEYKEILKKEEEEERKRKEKYRKRPTEEDNNLLKIEE